MRNPSTGPGRRVPAVFLLATLCLAASLTTTGAAQNQTIWDGVYTEEQASRGQRAYEQECAACHLDDLMGDGIAPSLIGSAFFFRWSELSMSDMYTAIRTTMPQGAPASLSPSGYADISSTSSTSGVEFARHQRASSTLIAPSAPTAARTSCQTLLG